MNRKTLPKSHRLCSTKAVEHLFSKGQSAIAYPLRAVYCFREDSRTEVPVRFMLTVPKKKQRHAVDRVLLRRRMREAYRLNRDILFTSLADSHLQCDMAFIYLSTHKSDYATIEASMKQLLDKISKDASQP